MPALDWATGAVRAEKEITNRCTCLLSRVTPNSRRFHVFRPKSPSHPYFFGGPKTKAAPMITPANVICSYHASGADYSRQIHLQGPRRDASERHLPPAPWRPWPAERLRVTSVRYHRPPQPVTVSPGCVCPAGRTQGSRDEPVWGFGGRRGPI